MHWRPSFVLAVCFSQLARTAPIPATTPSTITLGPSDGSVRTTTAEEELRHDLLDQSGTLECSKGPDTPELICLTKEDLRIVGKKLVTAAHLRLTNVEIVSQTDLELNMRYTDVEHSEPLAVRVRLREPKLNTKQDGISLSADSSSSSLHVSHRKRSGEGKVLAKRLDETTMINHAKDLLTRGGIICQKVPKELELRCAVKSSGDSIQQCESFFRENQDSFAGNVDREEGQFRGSYKSSKNLPFIVKIDDAEHTSFEQQLAKQRDAARRRAASKKIIKPQHEAAAVPKASTRLKDIRKASAPHGADLASHAAHVDEVAAMKDAFQDGKIYCQKIPNEMKFMCAVLPAQYEKNTLHDYLLTKFVDVKLEHDKDKAVFTGECTSSSSSSHSYSFTIVENKRIYDGYKTTHGMQQNLPVPQRQTGSPGSIHHKKRPSNSDLTEGRPRKKSSAAGSESDSVLAQHSTTPHLSTEGAQALPWPHIAESEMSRSESEFQTTKRLVAVISDISCHKKLKKNVMNCLTLGSTDMSQLQKKLVADFRDAHDGGEFRIESQDTKKFAGVFKARNSKQSVIITVLGVDERKYQDWVDELAKKKDK